MALRVRVCRIDEVSPGDHRGFAVAGVAWPILIANLDGRLVATAGVCPHEDVELADGELRGQRIRCPGHSYEFDLVTGRCAHDARLQLARYRVEVISGEVWVELI